MSAEEEKPYIITNPFYTLHKQPWGDSYWTEKTVLGTFLHRCNDEKRRDMRFVGRHVTTLTPPKEEDHDKETNFEFKTYAEARTEICALATGLQRAFGIKAGDHIAMFSAACPEYVLLSLACAALRCVFIPINENSSEEHIRCIVANSDAVLAFVSPVRQHERTISLFNELLPNRIVLLDNVSSFNNNSVKMLTYSDILSQGGSSTNAQWDSNWEEPTMDDLFVIMYTSGTTGTPKGVMLSHRNIVEGSNALLATIPEHLRTVDPWIYFSLLPLSHIYGLAMCYVVLILGGHTIFFSGNRARMMREMREAHPTLICAVPRVYEKIYDGIWENVANQGFLVRSAFYAAWGWKRWWAGAPSPLADTVFSKVRDQFGGNLKIALCGGSPMGLAVAEFFRLVVVPEFYDGYGMTETVATGIRTQPGEPVSDFGLMCPFYNYELKIASVPEMGYLSTDNPPRGEMCLRSPAVTSGYYKDPETTARVLDEDGFIHTGDIVIEEKPGKVRIIDRLKNMFKLSQGEYVSGEAVEAAIAKSPVVGCVFVHGVSTQPYPFAVVVPEHSVLREWAVQNGLESIADDMDALCRNEKVREYVEAEILRVSKEAGLKGYEIVHKFVLHAKPFDEERDLVTSTLKLKRHNLRKYFQNDFDALIASK